MFSFLIFLLVLSVLVLVHELGHFFAARIFGVKAEEFGYGFPPRLFGFVRVNGAWKRVGWRDQKTYPRTIWSVNWLPLGGFVRLKGEQGDAAQDHDSFAAKSVSARLVIVAAGVVMNWLLAALIFSVGFLVGVPAQVDELPRGAEVRNPKVQIVQVLAKSPAEQAGLLPGDFVLKIDGQALTKAEEARQSLSERSQAQKTITFEVERQGKIQELQATPALIASLNRPGVGISMSDTAIVRFPWYRAIGQGVTVAWIYTKLIVVGFFSLVRQLVVGEPIGADVSGPIGIAVMTGRLARQGWATIAHFTAMLSLNLAVINFLPVPALDGGRALMLVWEAISRRRVNVRVEAAIHRIGFGALMILVVLVTLKDLRQYGGMIWTGLKQVVGL